MLRLHCSSSWQQLSEDRTQQLWTTGRARQWRPIESREVSERRNVDRTRKMVSDRTRQRVRSTVSADGRDDRTRPVNGRKLGFVFNGYFLHVNYK